jgi:predicted site-specific integrase-resolvase
MRLPIGKASKILGVTPKTMRRYCELGLVDAQRLPTGRWRVESDSLESTMAIDRTKALDFLRSAGVCG